MDERSFTLAIGLGVALGFFVGIPIHEFAHHRVAAMLGDRTAKLHGRSSLSLKAHADPLGTYILPAVFVFIGLFSPQYLGYYPPFGWGKPHALGVYPTRSKGKPIAVALAGPVATGILASVFGALSRNVKSTSFAELVGAAALVLATLTVIELLPLPGRDGGRILQRFLSPSAAMKMEELAQYHVAFILGLYLLLGFLARGLVGAACDFLKAC